MLAAAGYDSIICLTIGFLAYALSSPLENSDRLKIIAYRARSLREIHLEISHESSGTVGKDANTFAPFLFFLFITHESIIIIASANYCPGVWLPCAT